MQLRLKYRTGVLLFVVALARFAQAQTQPQTPPVSTTATVTAPRPNFVGDDACNSCHAKKVETFHQSAHYLTSRLPSNDRSSAISHPAQTFSKLQPGFILPDGTKRRLFFPDSSGRRCSLQRVRPLATALTATCPSGRRISLSLTGRATSKDPRFVLHWIKTYSERNYFIRRRREVSGPSGPM